MMMMMPCYPSKCHSFRARYRNYSIIFILIRFLLSIIVVAVDMCCKRPSTRPIPAHGLRLHIPIVLPVVCLAHSNNHSR